MLDLDIPKNFLDWCEARNVSRETAAQLQNYVAILKKWATKQNLIGKTTLENVWDRHIWDCAQLLDHVPNRTLPILDIGSGAGLPGLILSVMGCTDVHLVESDLRKASFLKICIQELHSTATLHHQRLEKLKSDSYALITSRACASLETLLQMTENFRDEKTVCLFPKGKKYSTELLEAKKQYHFEVNVLPSVTSPDGVILHITHIRRRS